MRSWGQLVGDTTKELRNPQSRIPTGFPSMDALLDGGLRKKSLNLVIARQEVGKSAVAIQMAVSAVTAGHSCLFVSLEMDADECVVRALSSHMDLPVHIVEDMLKSETPPPALLQANADLRNLTVYDSTKPDWNDLKKLRADLRQPADLIVLDTLRAMKRYGYPKGEVERVQTLAEDAKAFAKQEEIALLALHHVGRGGAEDGNHGHKPVTAEDSYYGGEFEADRMFGLFRPERDPSLNPNQRRALKGLTYFQVVKNRQGESCYEGIPLMWKRPSMRFEEVYETQFIPYLGGEREDTNANA